MKKILISTICSLILNSAAAMPPKPAKCPSVSALQTSVFVDADQDEDGVWEVGVLNNNYDTKEGWTFFLRNLFANGRQDALNRGTKALKTLSFQQGPTAISDFDMWVCNYITAEGYEGVAVTPAFEMKAAKGIK